MDTAQSSSETTHENHHHLESAGYVEYQRVGGLNTSGSVPDHYKHSQEYADVALEVFRPPSQHEDHDTQPRHRMHRESSGNEDVDDDENDQIDDPNGADSSDCQVSASSTAKLEQATMMMQPLYNGQLIQQQEPRGNNSDLDSITRSQRQLQDGYGNSVEQKSAAETSEFYKGDMQTGQSLHMAAPMQSSFEGYQTDMTNTSNPHTAYNEQQQLQQQSEGQIDLNSTTDGPAQHNWQTEPFYPAQKSSVVEYTEVFVWGEDRKGQLGIDSQLQAANDQRFQRPDFIQIPRSCSFNIVIREVSCGESHSAIVTEHGHLYMMGSNLVGQLGVSTVGPPPELERQLESVPPAQIEALYCAGSPILVEALKSICVEQVSCGADFTAAVCRRRGVQSDSVHHGVKSEVYAWGNNEFGQLGDGELLKTNNPIRVDAFDVLEEEIIMVSCGGSHTLFLTSDHDVISCGNNTHGQCGFDPDECAQTSTPFKVAAFDGVSVQQISSGFDHSLYLSADGKVFASGSNLELQLGIGDSFERTQTPVLVQALEKNQVTKVEAGFNSAAINQQGQLFLWGRGVWGETPFPHQIMTISNAVIDVSLGRDVGVAVDDQGLAWSWGPNTNGELGVGDTQPRIHPFPILNMKGKVVRQAHCGYTFSVCLGNNVQKEVPAQGQSQAIAQVHQAYESRKKKVFKKKKVNGDSMKRKSIRPQSSAHPGSNKFAESGHNVHLVQKKSVRQAVDSKNTTFGMQGNSRSSSFDRNTALAANSLKRHTRHASNRRPSKERTLANLQQKYSASSALSGQRSATNQLSQQRESGQAMQVVTLLSHEKSRVYSDQVVNSGDKAGSGNSRSPIVAKSHMEQRPPLQDYELGMRPSESDITRTMKQLKKQMKSLKDENRALKQELHGKCGQIEKLEKTVQKLQSNEAHEKQVQELGADLKRTEMKLRKMKERRNHYRTEKDQLMAKVGEMQKDNESLFEQVTGLQEKSHSTREDNSKLSAKLRNVERQLEKVNNELTSVSGQAEVIKSQNDQVEKEFQGQIRWQESKITDLEGQVKFESDQRGKMAQEIVRLEKMVQSREDYMCQLENESIQLRKEIKNAKFNNEKSGYTGFLSGLTSLRRNGERSKSNNRIGGVSPTALPLEKRSLNNSSNAVPIKQERGHDELPSRDDKSANDRFEERRTSSNPPKQLFSASKPEPQDARSRLMMRDVVQQPQQPKQEAYPAYSQLKKAISPTRQLHHAQSTQKPRAPAQPSQNEALQRRPEQQHHYQTISSHLSENIETKVVQPNAYEPASKSTTNAHLSHNITDQGSFSQQETVLAVVPLEDMRVLEEPILSSGRNSAYEPPMVALMKENRPNVDDLADNSMVIQPQHSELICKEAPAASLQAENEPAIASSSFTDQTRKINSILNTNTDKSGETRKVSTMIPLGAPKGDDDIREKYKNMLMAKLDKKTIARRQRQDHSQEPAE